MNTTDKIRDIRNKLFEATSSYEDRVLRVAQKVMKREDLTSDELDFEIEDASKILEVTEYRLKGKAWKAFVKDVKDKMRKLGWKAKRKSNPDRPKKDTFDYDKLAQDIIWAIGNVFPDGDPHDACLEWCRKNHVSSERFFHEIWPKTKKAFKKATGFDDLYDYYEDLLKQHKLDNPETEDIYTDS